MFIFKVEIIIYMFFSGIAFIQDYALALCCWHLSDTAAI